METIDAISDNQAYLFLSYSATSDANSEIDDVKRSLHELNDALERFGANVNGSEIAGVSDGLDLFVDSMGSAFDFMSWMNLRALSAADDSLADVEGKVDQVRAALGAKFDAVDKVFRAYVCESRGICTNGQSTTPSMYP